MSSMRSSLERCQSDGERLLFDFFESKLPDDYWVWNNVEYSYSQSDRVYEGELDFILHSGDIGILLMEVKDWRIAHLSEITKDIVRIVNGRQEGNPANVLKYKFYSIQSKLSSRPELCKHKRRLKCYPRLSSDVGIQSNNFARAGETIWSSRKKPSWR